jgi:hypothetical protein
MWGEVQSAALFCWKAAKLIFQVSLFQQLTKPFPKWELDPQLLFP